MQIAKTNWAWLTQQTDPDFMFDVKSQQEKWSWLIVRILTAFPTRSYFGLSLVMCSCTHDSLFLFFCTCPVSQVKKTRRTYMIGSLLSWPCVSDLLYWSKRRERLRAVTLDDSKTPTPVLHNTSVVVWNLYCVRVIIVRLNKRSEPRSFVHN